MYWAALILGFFGSFHCLGMCGPIALALNGGQPPGGRVVVERVLYNLGRAVTYSLLGASAGLLGKGLVLVAGYHAYLSLVLGGGLVLVGLFAANPEKFLAKTPFVAGWFKALRTMLAGYLNKNGIQAFFMVGLLNGLLPCGLVYMGLVGAVATGGFFEGMAYMLVFGLGTFPAMLAVALAGSFFSLKSRGMVKKIYPALFVGLGIFLMLRGYQTGVVPPGQGTAKAVPEVICH